mgnify:CR=1 FL=1
MSDSDSPSDHDLRHAVALFRYGLIADLVHLPPGTQGHRVELEVADRIEIALQEMPQLDNVESWSRAGEALVAVEIKDQYWADRLPQVWDELRRKVGDAQGYLPPGAGPSVVNDDFGDVYGLFYALSGDGYSYRELKDYADILEEQLLLVPGVKKIAIDGSQQEVIYLEVSRSTMASLGISNQQFFEVLKSQNLVSDSGNVRVGDEYIRINPTGQLMSAHEIGELLISSSTGTLIRIKDFATVRRAYEEVPNKYIYFNGKAALTIGISMLPGENVVAVCQRLDQRLHGRVLHLPRGLVDDQA